MSAKYSLNQFMWDFIALWKNPELEKLSPTDEQRGHLARAFFQHQHGENAEAFGNLHMKVLVVLIEYLKDHRPELSKAVERTPNSLLVGLFYLIDEKGIDHPTSAQIEAAEISQAPKN